MGGDVTNNHSSSLGESREQQLFSKRLGENQGGNENQNQQNQNLNPEYSFHQKQNQNSPNNDDLTPERAVNTTALTGDSEHDMTLLKSRQLLANLNQTNPTKSDEYLHFSVRRP